MSTHRTRSVLKRAHDNREHNIILINELYPPYWEEGTNFYPRYRRGFVNPNKRLEAFEMRMYRSWKHNRKTQYKQCNVV